MIKNPRLAFALAFPIALLAGHTAYKQARVMIGTTVVVPIAGFDPRDLLSGHFLTYRLDMGEGGLGNGFLEGVLVHGGAPEAKNGDYTALGLPCADILSCRRRHPGAGNIAATAAP